MRIDGENGSARSEQLVHALHKEGGAVATADHGRVADELVKPARTGGKMSEVMPYW